MPNAEDEDQPGTQLAKQKALTAQGKGPLPARAYNYLSTQKPSEDDYRAPAARRAPSRFVNFDRYFAANKAAADKGASNLAAQVGAQAQGARDAVNKASTGFAKDAYGWIDENRYTGQTVDPGSSTSTQGLQGTPQKSTGNTLTPEEAAQRANMQYTGPSSLTEAQGFDDLQGQVQKASSAVTQLGSDAGIEALSGGSAFDANLFGSAGRSKFADTQSKFAGLDKHFDDAIDYTKGVGDKAKEWADYSAKEYGKAYDDYERTADARDAARIEREQLADAENVWTQAPRDLQARVAEMFEDFEMREAAGEPEWWHPDSAKYRTQKNERDILKKEAERRFGPGAWEKLRLAYSHAKRRGETKDFAKSPNVRPF